MVWLIIAGVFLLALGPILLAMPSARDRRLAALRTQARQLGIAFQLTELPHPAPTAEQQVSAGGVRRSPMLPCTVYRLPVTRAAASHDAFAAEGADAPAVSSAKESSGGGWRLQRRNAAQVAGLPPGWEWFPADSSASAQVVQLLAGLPQDVLAIEGARGSVALYWTEDAGAQRLQEVFTVLEQLRALMQAAPGANAAGGR